MQLDNELSEIDTGTSIENEIVSAHTSIASWSGRQVSYKENEENEEPVSTTDNQQQVDTKSLSPGQSIHFQGKKIKLKAPEDETPVKQVPPHTGRNFTNAVWANFDPNQMVSQPCLLPGERQNA